MKKRTTRLLLTVGLLTLTGLVLPDTSLLAIWPVPPAQQLDAYLFRTHTLLILAVLVVGLLLYTGLNRYLAVLSGSASEDGRFYTHPARSHQYQTSQETAVYRRDRSLYKGGRVNGCFSSTSHSANFTPTPYNPSQLYQPTYQQGYRFMDNTTS